MTLTFPLPLIALRDEHTHDFLDLLYGPGWSIAVNGVVEIVPTNWAEMTRAERERGRERIMELWRRKGWMAA